MTLLNEGQSGISVPEQLIVSTAEEEYNYYGVVHNVLPSNDPPTVAPGDYQLIDGQLYRIVPGVAPHLNQTEG